MSRPIRRPLANVMRALPQISYFPRMVALVWRSAPGWTLAWAALIVIAGLLPATTILLTKYFVNDIVAAAQSRGSWEAVKPLIVTGILLGATAVLIEMLSGVMEWIRTVQTELIQDHLSALIQRKSVEVDFAFYESPEYYDRLYRARDDAQGKITILLEHLGSALQNSITLVALTTIVASYNALLLIGMFLSVIPAFFIVAQYNWLTHQWWRATTVARRWTQYYDQKFSSPAAAAEMRLFQLGPYFQAAYQKLRDELRESRLHLIKRQNLARFGASLIGVAVAGGAICWMGWKTLNGQGTFGDLALFYQAFLGGQGFMRAITLSVGQVYSSSLFLSNLFEFLDLAPSIVDPSRPVAPPVPIRNGIEFNHVTFRYPNSRRVALDDLSLFIPAGTVAAVVGPNGAGKSTLIKLLSRFYDPEEGYIAIDGVRLQELALQDLRSLLSILFQIPVTYDATAAENIAIGDLSRKPTPTRIETAGVSAGADEIISTLPQKYNTLLGKSFTDGTDLSAGEWQRIAMARAFFRKAPILLLDEPTSFMDSWAEVDWFDRVRQLAKGRTALIITHRFTIAMRADVIHVMNEGRVVESGTHESLLQKGGLYSKSWHDQMSAPSGLAALA